jgi:hypothetical protein
VKLTRVCWAVHVVGHSVDKVTANRLGAKAVRRGMLVTSAPRVAEYLKGSPTAHRPMVHVVPQDSAVHLGPNAVVWAVLLLTQFAAVMPHIALLASSVRPFKASMAVCGEGQATSTAGYKGTTKPPPLSLPSTTPNTTSDATPYQSSPKLGIMSLTVGVWLFVLMLN